ncbi:MAG: DUF2336 domain-containing protein [Pseudomonadota bacterium]
MATTSDNSLSTRLNDVEDAGAAQRSALTRTLCDLVVLPANKISANERSLTADMLLEILGRAEIELRLELARRVARVRETPPALMRALLHDAPEVAIRLLEKAEYIPEALLVECARTGETNHRLALVRRLDLSPSVADAVLEFQEPEVTQLLLRREEFELSPGAVDILVARSASDVTLQGPLLMRPELEPAHGFMMFWWVDTERRKRILSRFSISRVLIQDALDDLYASILGKSRQLSDPSQEVDDVGIDPFVRELLILLDRRNRPRSAKGEPVPIDMVRRTIHAVRLGLGQQVLHAASVVTGLSRELVARIFRDPTGEPFAVMCKSLGLPRNAFFELITLEDADTIYPIERADDLMGVFDSLSRDFARAILRYWDWDGNPRIAQITRLIDAGFDAAH